jgi:hypothetical protein
MKIPRFAFLLAAVLFAHLLLRSDALFAQCTPVFTTHPANATPANPGVTVILSGAATNATSYQWFKNNVAIGGATLSQLTLTNAEQGKDGGSYFLQARNACGAVNSNPATVRVRCSSSPGKNTRNIQRALTPGQLDYCDWVEDISPNFPYSSTDTNGSYNRPVVSAAVAFIREPVRNNPSGKSWDMIDWWTTYLRGELGLRGTAWYYGGSEVGSFTYSHFNVVSVMAVYYQATLPNQTPQVQAIGDLAKRWLRATFALHALAAGPQWPLTKHAYDEIADDGTDWRTMGSGNFTGAFVAMAGERSNSEHWNDAHRSILFSKAVAWFPTNNAHENPDVGVARAQLESLWQTRSGNSANAYGFTTAAERTALRNIITAGTLPSNLVSFYLGAELRTKVRYHFVAWQPPAAPFVRVTLMETNEHNFTAPTTGVAYFTNAVDQGGREAHFLYPWAGVFGSGPESGQGITNTTGVYDSVNRFIQSSNNNAGAPHGPRVARISGLPLQAHKYWVTINPESNLPPTVRNP